MADTLETVHLYTQVVGRIRMAYGPWLNHSWGVTLYATPRGLTTGTVPYGDDAFEIRFDFIIQTIWPSGTVIRSSASTP